MWTVQQRTVERESVLKVEICDQSRPLSCAEVLSGWQENAAFRSFFIDLLAELPYRAYFWETPPLCVETRERAFEFVVTESALLDRLPPDRSAFSAHFEGAHTDIVGFDNLGADAFLIAPVPAGDDSVFVHLGRYARLGPVGQQHRLWQTVATAVSARLGRRRLWLSTSGTGVGWLHVRLDQRPKYYVHAPYRGVEE